MFTPAPTSGFTTNGWNSFRSICSPAWSSFASTPKFAPSSGLRTSNFTRVSQLSIYQIIFYDYIDYSFVIETKKQPESKASRQQREGSLSMAVDPASGVSRSGSSAALLSAREEALKTRRNVVKMLVACVSVYFICYSPIQAIFLSRFVHQIN
jgi:hypothetical protein